MEIDWLQVIELAIFGTITLALGYAIGHKDGHKDGHREGYTRGREISRVRVLL